MTELHSYSEDVRRAGEGDRSPSLAWSIEVAPTIARQLTQGLSPATPDEPLEPVSHRRVHRERFGCFSGHLAHSSAALDRKLVAAVGREDPLVEIVAPLVATSLFAMSRADRRPRLALLPAPLRQPTIRWFERLRGSESRLFADHSLTALDHALQCSRDTRTVAVTLLAPLLGALYRDELLVMGQQESCVLEVLLTAHERDLARAIHRWLTEILGDEDES